MADEAGGGEEDEDAKIKRATLEAVNELRSGEHVSSLVKTKYVARLFCGHDVAGEMMATHVRLGSHGEWCFQCEAAWAAMETREPTPNFFSLYADLVSAAPLVA